jgi:hypothetical protein
LFTTAPSSWTIAGVCGGTVLPPAKQPLETTTMAKAKKTAKKKQKKSSKKKK